MIYAKQIGQDDAQQQVLDGIVSGFLNALLISVETTECGLILNFDDTSQIDEYVARLLYRGQLTGREKAPILLISYLTQTNYSLLHEGKIVTSFEIESSEAYEGRVYTTTDEDVSFNVKGEVKELDFTHDVIEQTSDMVKGALESKDFDQIDYLISSIVPKKVAATKQRSKPTKQYDKEQKKRKAKLTKDSRRRNR